MAKHRYPKWDLQHHAVPTVYVNALAERGITGIDGVAFPKWSVKKSLGMMNQWNVERAFLSVSCPGIHFGDDAAARDLAKSCNDELMAHMSSHSNRFGGFASLPLPDVDGAIAEYDRAVRDGGMDGVILMSNVGGRYVGDPSYRPLFERMNEDGALVFIHPNTTPTQAGNGFLNIYYWWFLDTTKAILSLLDAGFNRDYPHIRYVAAHGGGILPAIAEVLRRERPIQAAELDAWKGQLYLDTAKFVTGDAIPSLLEFTDPSHVVFSSDFPWAGKSKMAYWTQQLDESFPKAYRERMYRGNAQVLFADETVPVSAIATPSGPLPQLHLHAIPEAIEADIRALGIEPDPSLRFDIGRIKTWKEDHGDLCHVTLDLPELWLLPSGEVDQFLMRYNTALARCAAEYPGEFLAVGAIDASDEGRAIGAIDHCLEELGLDGICLFPSSDLANNDTALGPRLVSRLSQVEQPILIHPTDARGLPVANETSLDSVLLLAKILWSGEADELEECRFVATHTHRVHRILHDFIGMLYYLGKDRKLMGRFVLDYVRKRPLRGEAFLERVLAD